MHRFAIRCHPSLPVTTGELEEWLELQLEALRADLPTAVIRMSRIAQGLPSGSVELGWLLEFEVPDHVRKRADDQIWAILTDMRLLGFQPTVLEPVDASTWRDAHGGGALVSSNGTPHGDPR
jgi:hypothetical protein